MNKQKVVLHGIAAREKLLEGVDFLADAVKSTLGPYGLNAVSGLKGTVVVTNDGVTIASDISHEDEIVNLGIRTLREAAIKTNERAGDGTTTATTLAQAIAHKAVSLLPSENTFKGRMAPRALVSQIEAETAEVIEKLVPEAVASREELIGVARVAVEDEKLAELIGGMQWDLGPEGTIIAEESNDKEDSIVRSSGVHVDNGFPSSLVINDPTKQRVEVADAAFIITNYTFSGVQPFKPIAGVLDHLVKNENVTNIIIMARAFDDTAIRICLENAAAGVKILPVNAPYVDQTQVMLDIAAVTGATFINSEERTLSSLTRLDVGHVSQAHVYRFSAVYTGRNDEAARERIRARVAELEKAYEGSESEFEKKGIEARKAQLENGFALLKITGTSLVERKYKKDKADDCVNAVKSALKYGTVKGAGLALKEIADTLPDSYIIKEPLKAPYNQIMANAGEAFEVPVWVRDSVFVVRTALDAAASVAATLATAATAYDWKNDKPRYVEETKRED